MPQKALNDSCQKEYQRSMMFISSGSLNLHFSLVKGKLNAYICPMTEGAVLRDGQHGNMRPEFQGRGTWPPRSIGKK